MTTLPKAYRAATHRVCPPEATLQRIAPHLFDVGITRCADVTGLDRIGIPVYCAIRPRARTLQVSNGKGIRHADAKASALMESIEVSHAETAPLSAARGSMAALRAEGLEVVAPDGILCSWDKCYFGESFVMDWIPAENLLDGGRVYVPASTTYLCQPTFWPWDTNGLASGNDLTEATLHGLYEVIERDAISRLSRGGRLDLYREALGGLCRVVDLDTVTDEIVGPLIEKVLRAGLRLTLIWVRSQVPVHTFWAILLDGTPFSEATACNYGFGTHLNRSAAAARAIAEAAQTRLTFIHGSREDLSPEAYRTTKGRVREYFGQLPATTGWTELDPDLDAVDLMDDYEVLIQSLRGLRRGAVYRTDLTRPPANIPVVKVFVPWMTINHRLF